MCVRVRAQFCIHTYSRSLPVSPHSLSLNIPHNHLIFCYKRTDTQPQVLRGDVNGLNTKVIGLESRCPAGASRRADMSLCGEELVPITFTAGNKRVRYNRVHMCIRMYIHACILCKHVFNIFYRGQELVCITFTVNKRQQKQMNSWLYNCIRMYSCTYNVIAIVYTCKVMKYRDILHINVYIYMYIYMYIYICIYIYEKLQTRLCMSSCVVCCCVC